MGVFQVLRRLGSGYAALALTDQIACDAGAMTVTPTNGISATLPDVLHAALNPNAGTDNLAPTNGTFGNGPGVAGPYDLMSGGAAITAVSDLMFGSSSIDLMSS